MNPSQRFLSALGAVTMLAFSSGASAVPFNITVASFAPGSGYGVDPNEASGTLLDVLFTTTFAPQNFTLGAVGDSRTFDVGTIQFREDNAHSGILSSETDGLDIGVTLTFTDPFGTLVPFLVIGSATTGSVSDSATDYVIDWNPVQFAFGSGGLVEVALDDMTFTGLQTLTERATVTLLRTSESPPPGTAIPEPASLALLGLGIGCAAITRRRRSA